MPCSGCGDDYDNDEVKIEYIDNPIFKNEIDNLTQMLCYLCGEYIYKFQNNESTLYTTNKKLNEWWNKHLINDSNRVINEIIDFIKINPEYTDDQIVNYFISKASKVHEVSIWHSNIFFYNCYKQALNKLGLTYSTNILIKNIKNKISPDELNELLKLIHSKK